MADKLRSKELFRIAEFVSDASEDIETAANRIASDDLYNCARLHSCVRHLQDIVGDLTKEAAKRASTG